MAFPEDWGGGGCGGGEGVGDGGGCGNSPAQDYINQSIYFPRGARRKSLQIPVKLDNRRTGAPRVTLCRTFFFFAHFTNLMDLVLSNFVEQYVWKRRKKREGGGGGGGEGWCGGGGGCKARGIEAFEKTNSIIGWKRGAQVEKKQH